MLAVLAVVALAAAGCSRAGQMPAASGGGGERGQAAGEAAEPGSLPGDVSATDARGTAGEDRRGTGGGAGGSGRAGRAGGARLGGLDLSRARSVVRDPRDDADTGGSTPRYAEMTGAAIRGLGDSVRVTVTFADDLPARMMDESTHMTVDVRITKQGRDLSLYAQGSQHGWRPFFSTDDETSALSRSTLTRDGPRISITVPWRRLGGPSRFTWTALSAWTRGTLLRTHFAFDSAPNHGPAPYPR